MAAPWYDIVVVGDLRFPGGTSAAVAEELRAQAGAGYRIGLLHLKGPILRYPHPIHPGIRACIDQDLADVLDPDVPVTADLVLAHHPSLFTHLPRRVLPVTASRRLLIVHHPPLDGAGTPAYDWVAVHRHATAALGGELLWAPVGPTVRRQFARLPARPLYAPAVHRARLHPPERFGIT